MENCYEAIDPSKTLILIKGLIQIQDGSNISELFSDSSAIFTHSNFSISSSTAEVDIKDFQISQISLLSIIKISLNFSYSANTCNTPVIVVNESQEVSGSNPLALNYLIELDGDKISFEFLKNKMLRFFEKLEISGRFFDCPIRYLESFYFHCNPNILGLLYPRKYSDKEEDLRKEVHNKFNLPSNVPFLRRYQTILSPFYYKKNLGPNEEVLVNPHEKMKGFIKEEVMGLFVIKGKYSYKHYLQDDINDDKWGCAYRSLQTLASWLIWQDHINYAKIPSIRKIQETLIKLKEKPAAFLGSRDWIGSLEIQFVLQSLFNVSCPIISLTQINQLVDYSQELAEHFDSNGGPIMIGGGHLAHTIIGVDLRTVNKPKFLVLDPHYTGKKCDIGEILSKGYVAWKEVTFWKAKTPYNLCLCPPFPELESL